MNILVTGGAGFIGSHTVVELIAAGFEPIILDDFSNSEPKVLDRLETILGRKVKSYSANCNDSALLTKIFKEENIQGVIHFAASKAVGESVEKPLLYYRNNISALVTLLEAMTANGVSNLVFSSSCTVYGQPDSIPVTEETPVLPAASPYGNTKQVGEEIIRDTVAAKPGLKALALRYFNPVGAHESALIGELPIGVPANLVPFVTQTAIGIRSKLMVFGNDYGTPDGTCIRDFIHVVDLAKAHVKALELLVKQEDANYYEYFNIGTGKGTSVKELIDTFEEVTGVKVNYEFAPRRAGDIMEIYAEVSKSRDVLGWQAEKTLAEALADAWRWQEQLAK
ncbi:MULTISPECIES: UDP-glucose 4-epimerase GalE [unclassified Siphonobacter]|uniref:UDP-glucose 4-epimerase GalE n=1 Tax=unclassified Siphonobacter TaxID=2635712 RepID=UPI000CCB3FE3|nr:MULTISPECIES: UDP-glucose 4-epimerase GalE [unclassified Siphonobacter]MDQ1086210.1 UDP-glucose 4-epimerase [Siphonobacter sp. SORGH_AS_1065]PKK37604.1 UDP-glucose 4-epimerase GalE [Siphonobacter sp. SORGH_AS_0500]